MWKCTGQAQSNTGPGNPPRLQWFVVQQLPWTVLSSTEQPILPPKHLLPVPCRDKNILLHWLHFIHSSTALSIKATKCLVEFLMKNKCLQPETADEKHQPARCPAPSSKEEATMQHSLLSPTLALQTLPGAGGRANGSCWKDRWENRTQKGKETA